MKSSSANSFNDNK